jgi:excisionase family DNA binding protein
VPAPLAYTVAQAAQTVGMSRYVIYEAIRNRELVAYRPGARADLKILPEDLREWVTRHQVEDTVPRETPKEDQGVFAAAPLSICSALNNGPEAN